MSRRPWDDHDRRARGHYLRGHGGRTRNNDCMTALSDGSMTVIALEADMVLGITDALEPSLISASTVVSDRLLPAGSEDRPHVLRSLRDRIFPRETRLLREGCHRLNQLIDLAID